MKRILCRSYMHDVPDHRWNNKSRTSLKVLQAGHCLECGDLMLRWVPVSWTL